MKYRVVVRNFPEQVTSRNIRAIRLLGRLSLKDVVEIARYAGGLKMVVLATGMDGTVASRSCESLRAAGLEASFEECDDPFPMIMAPRVIQLHRWSWGRVVAASTGSDSGT